MQTQTKSGGFSTRALETLKPMTGHEPGAVRLSQACEMREEILPFSVRLVRNQDDLGKAVHIRHSAYARHMPAFAEKLKTPESTDSESGVVVLLAQSKLDGSPLGTLRIQTNQYKALSLEQSVTLPDWMFDRTLAEGTRLAVTNEKTGRMVKVSLIKAGFQFCELEGVDLMLLAARAPLDRQYSRMLFEDVYPEIGFIPMAHGNNIPHRIMACEIATARARALSAQHPLFDFFYTTYHPDIDISKDSVRPLAQQFGSLSISPVALRM